MFLRLIKEKHATIKKVRRIAIYCYFTGKGTSYHCKTEKLDKPLCSIMLCGFDKRYLFGRCNDS